MSFINPITDFDIAMGQQEPKVAQAIFEQAGVDQETFESYWRHTIQHIQKQIEQDTLLDITPFQKDFLLTLLTNCADNALWDGDEYAQLTQTRSG